LLVHTQFLDESVDPWEVLEHVHTTKENLEYDSGLTDCFRNSIAMALEERLETRVETNPSRLG